MRLPRHNLTDRRREALEKVAAHPGEMQVEDLVVGRYNPCLTLMRLGWIARAPGEWDGERLPGYILTEAGREALSGS